MGHRHHDLDELREIARMLQSERPSLDPLALDRIKRDAISSAQRPSRSRRLIRGSLVRSPAMVLATLVLVAMGGGTAIAVCGGSGGPNPPGEGENAGYGQYKNGCPPGYVEDTGSKDCCVSGGKEGSKYDSLTSSTDTYGKQGGAEACCETSSSKTSPTYNGLNDQKSSTPSCCETSSSKTSPTYNGLNQKSSTPTCCESSSSYSPTYNGLNDQKSGGCETSKTGW